LNTEQEVIITLDEVLSLQGRATQFNRETPRLGTLPEFDSTAAITVIATLEERFDITVEDWFALLRHFQVKRLPDADHTFSDPTQTELVSSLTLEWILSR
jgi:acyl carrier protein